MNATGLRHVVTTLPALAAGIIACGKEPAAPQPSTPTPTPTPITLSAVSAGYFHTCGITATGATYCWGKNSLGQLGDGTTILRTSAVVVTDWSFAAVRAGGASTRDAPPRQPAYSPKQKNRTY